MRVHVVCTRDRPAALASCLKSLSRMTPAAGDPNEVEGVLNPGSGRGPDGELYVFSMPHGMFRIAPA